MQAQATLRFKAAAGLATLALALGAVTSEAVQYSFYNITTEPAITDANNAADQVFVDVTSPESGKVMFLFSTVAGQPGIVTQVSFDQDGLGLLGLLDDEDWILDSDIDPVAYAGVDFKVGGAAIAPASPSFTLDISGKKNASVDNGLNVGSGEVLGFLFNGNLADVLAALDADSSPQLRIGLHIQALVGGESQKALSNGRVTVPDGGLTAVLLGMAMCSLALARRKRA